MNKLIRFVTDKNMRTLYFDSKGLYKNLDDKAYLQRIFEARMGYPLDLDEPKTFNEKMQWLKLYNRKDEYTRLVDKYEVREFVAQVIGKEFLIPLIGVWDRPEDIDWKKLPDEFVLKCNHNSGLGMCICHNKELIDKNRVLKKLMKGLKQDYYLTSREWPYKNVKRRIVAEEFIKDDRHGELRDYKVFLFNGIATYIQVDIDRFSNHRRNFYTTKWEYVPFTTCYPTAPEVTVEKPKQLMKLIGASEKIATAIGNPPFLRVDMYVLENIIYFGEITFYHGAGLEIFSPLLFDRKLGDLIELPISKQTDNEGRVVRNEK